MPGDGDVLIDDIRPKSDLTGVIVSAREDETGTTASWQVNALAICAYPPPGLARLSLTSALDSAKKSVTATCPTGKRLLGAGGEINSSNGQVLLDEVRPNSTLTGAVVNALEDETGNPQNWSLTAYAICANPVAGLQRMSAQSAVDSSISKVKEVSCPAGKQVTGGGGDINSPNGQVVLDALFPDVALTSFGVAAFEDDTENAGNWSLTAYAICANSAERIAAATGPDSGDKTVSAICPAGKGLTGGGGDITGGLGQVVLDDLTPFGTPPTRVEVSADEDEDGTTADWSLRAYAICATPLPGLEQVADSVPFDNSSPKSVTVSCPAGKRVVGAGRDIAGGLGEVVMNSTPNPTLTSVTVSGFEDEDGFAGDWGVAAIAVCASPPPRPAAGRRHERVPLRGGGQDRERPLSRRQEPARHRGRDHRGRRTGSAGRHPSQRRPDERPRDWGRGPERVRRRLERDLLRHLRQPLTAATAARPTRPAGTFRSRTEVIRG
jgi:hypothetical protein